MKGICCQLALFAGLVVVSSVVSSCDGCFDGIYDSAVSDTHYEEGIQSGVQSNRFKLRINARDLSQWIFIDLKHRSLERKPVPTMLTGTWDGRSGWTYNQVEGNCFTPLSTVKTDTQQEPECWDLAVHYLDARTNGGQVYETPYTSLHSLPSNSAAFAKATFTPDEWSTTQALVDLSDMLAYRVGCQHTWVNKVLSKWATMDFSTPPPVYSASNRVYILRLADGSHAALHLDSYVSPAGTKGFLTLDVIYPY